jgi:MFS family permease
MIGTAYAWSVFGAAWGAVLGVSTGMVFGYANSVGPITMIGGGRINDLLGPRWVIFVGGLMFGGGVFFAGLMAQKWALYLGYSILMGLGMGMIYGCTVNNTVKWFPDKRGLVGGLTTMSYGLGSVLLAPVGRWMVDQFTVSNTFMILGVIYAAVICIGAFFVSIVPAGYVPAGWTPPAPNPNVKAPQDKDWKKMLGDPVFYVIFLITLCGAFYGLMLLSQAMGIALDPKVFAMNKVVAANVVMALALFNTFGRLAAGSLSDKIGRINTLTLALIVGGAGLFLIYTGSTAATPNASLFVVGVCMVGFAFGSLMGILPAFVADQFGPKNNAMNYGIMFIGFACAGYLGPRIMGSVKAATGNFNQAYLIAIGFAAFGLVMTFVFRAMTKARA